eukprot:12087-Amphidinium_carterae.1
MGRKHVARKYVRFVATLPAELQDRHGYYAAVINLYMDKPGNATICTIVLWASKTQATYAKLWDRGNFR